MNELDEPSEPNEFYKFRATKVEVLPNFTLAIVFTDGSAKQIDLSKTVGKGLYGKLTDPGYFKLVYVNDGGVITWPDGEDFEPESLYTWETRRRFYEE